ncbi:hypothetical protein [Haloferula sp. BvORR071]|uniref:hypothetical protein n=1 Tax=Haloferula sp. BvORR071 TaxID=1396141 RepID=UPI000558FBA0|nr:hypothetical protein [Haloferula sp. BvORR071]
MVLLTILAVGLLTLSTVSLSTSGRESNLAEARANARMALAMAIAQLQKQTGPDQRITTTADQLASGSKGDESAATAERRHWTGVYNSWDSTATTRPGPSFRSWLVSGNFDDVKQVDAAKSSSDKDVIHLVAEGTLGKDAGTEGRVDAPAMRIRQSGSTSGDDKGSPRIAWWTGDQGVKAALSTPTVSTDTSLAATRAGLQTAPRNAVELAKAGTEYPFDDLKGDNPNMPKVTDWQQAGFVANSPKAPQKLFHDLASSSTGLLTNVRSGGFRKDLSMQLERPSATANATLNVSRTPALYKVGSGSNVENGINLLELWSYYNLYKELKTTGSAKYTTGGGNIPSGAPYLMVDSSATACQSDDEFYFKQPTIISYQMVLSLGSQTVNGATTLTVVADPIITMWNPLDVPVAIPTSAYMSIKYWQIPYDIMVKLDGGSWLRCPLIQSLSSSDGNFVSLLAGNQQQLVFKPGEVIKISQNGGMNTMGALTTDNHKLIGSAGFNLGNGIVYQLKTDAGTPVTISANSKIAYEVRPNGYTAGQSSTGQVPPGYATHSRHFSVTHHEVYVGDDRGSNSLGYGGMFIDWDFGNKRLKYGEDRGQTAPGVNGTKITGRFFAKDKPTVFKSVLEKDGRTLTGGQLAGSAGKAPIVIFSYNAKTEQGTDPAMRTRFLSRLNPKADFVDFFDLSQEELDAWPYEYTVDSLTSWKNRSLETAGAGNGFFGGGMNAQLGKSYVITHSIPREPIVSLAALQHSFANGFEMIRPKYGYAILNSREPLLPQISHAIGNSLAPPMIPANKTDGAMSGGGRLLADHSYLANQALWDTWFFSGITPQTLKTYSKQRAQKVVAEEFLNGSGKLPVTRYLPDTSGVDVQKTLAQLFSGANPTDLGTTLTASMIRVDGLFNVNSTSIEAWKTLLGSVKGRSVVVHSAAGADSVVGGNDKDTPVAGLLTPQNTLAKSGTTDVMNDAQWIGRRTLSDDEIDQLARAIVKQVRLRGPFLSLADFINRRPGNDKDLARAGAIQAALDSKDVKINDGFNDGDRAVATNVAGRFKFPEAEQGAAGYGMPGIVKQGDILTPIAPVLAARSDSFIVRAYGESVDKDGKILARAWCEAVVERGKDFVDSQDKPEVAIASLQSESNKNFGRRYKVAAFRWLHPDEV